MKVLVVLETKTPLRIRLSWDEADLLEEALLLAARSEDISSQAAAFVTELQDKLVEVRG